MAKISVRQPHYIYSYDRFKPVDFSYHMHQYYEILYFVSGNAKYVIENKEFDMSEGDIFMTRPNELHTIIFNSDSVYERHFIQFDYEFLNGLSQTLFASADRAFSFNKVPGAQARKYGIDKLFEGIAQCIKEKKAEWDLLTKTFIAQIVIAICNIHNINDNSQLSSPRIAKIKQYLNAHFTDDFSLQSIADKLYMNKYYMCHIFKQEVNITIKEYIEMLRFAYAQKLYYEGKKLSDIAVMCGYGDYPLFYKNFTKYSGGVSPSAYFKRNNKRSPLK